MNDKSYPSSMESNCGSAAATDAAAAAAPRTSQLKRSSAAVAAMARGGGAAVHLCANIYVTALLAPTFDIGP